MAGSKGGKHSNRKGNPKYNKSDTTNMKIEVSETSSIHCGRPRDPSDMNQDAVVNFEFSARESGISVNELEQLLYVKLDLLYTKAQDQLLKSGYSKAEVESAILNAGSTRGSMDIFNNVCQNAIAYMEKKAEPRTTAFKDLVELDKCTLKDMVDSVMETRHKQRGSAIWHLLVKNWGFIPSTSTISQLRSMDKSSLWFCGSHVNSSPSRNEDTGDVDPSSAEKVPSGIQIAASSKKVGLLERVNPTRALLSQLKLNSLIVRAVLKRKIEDPVIRLQAFPCVTGKPAEVPNIVRSDFLRSLTDCSYGACLIGCLESNSDEPKTALIVDLVKAIRVLHEKAEEQKEWAKKKVIDSARKLSKDVLELKTLRMMEFDKELNKQEKIYAEKSCKLMLMETEHGLQKMYSEIAFLTDTVKRLEREKAQRRANLEALRLDESEYEKEFKEVLKRERRCMRKLTDVEKQTRSFHSQFEEQKQRVVQLETELLEAEKEVYEAEVRHSTELD